MSKGGKNKVCPDKCEKAFLLKQVPKGEGKGGSGEA